MSGDEEDYMSDAILKQCADTRPGLVPAHVARRHRQDRKEREANDQNRQKPRAVVETERRTEGLGAALPSTNKGFSLLQKMGYKPGMALGKSGTGRSEPVPVEVKLGRGGLGRESDMKRKADHKQRLMKDMSLKKQKMAAIHKQEFMERMNEKFMGRNLERDLYESRKVCEQLDTQADISSPSEPFFWPEALQPVVTEEQVEPLDRLQPGYSSHIQDDSDTDADDDDDGEPEQDLCNFTVDEQLDIITLYLRTKHKYCIWCGTKYDDKADLMKHCPGNTAELHSDL